MDNFLFVRLATQCLTAIEAGGLRVESSNDFMQLSRKMPDISKKSLTPKMDPEKNDFLEGDGFWLGAYNGDELVAVIACNFQDLGGEGLSSFLLRSTNRQYGAQTIDYVAPQEVVNISGRTAYIGELFVKKEYRGKVGLLRPLVLLVATTCCLEWKIDYAYAFFRRRDFMARMPQLYGFTDHVPGVMRWAREVEGRGSSETMASISKHKINHIAHLSQFDPSWITLPLPAR